MRKITLTNDFHNSSATLLADVAMMPCGDVEAVIAQAAYRRAKRKLCGNPRCGCGGYRGPQRIEYTRGNWKRLCVTIGPS